MPRFRHYSRPFRYRSGKRLIGGFRVPDVKERATKKAKMIAKEAFEHALADYLGADVWEAVEDILPLFFL